MNTVIGTVLASQATSGAVIDFPINPAITARYVSVELHKTQYLHLAEVRVEEIMDSEGPIIATGE